MRNLKLALYCGLACVFPGSSWAIPQLQVFIDPALNQDAFYDEVTEDWIGFGSEVTISAFMSPIIDPQTGDGAPDPSDNFKWVITLSSEIDPNLVPLPTIDGLTATAADWTFGNPGLPPHGYFDGNFALYEFDLVGFGGLEIFDVQETTFNPDDGTIITLVGATDGFRRDFEFDFGVESAVYHIDLLDMDVLAGDDNEGNEYFLSAPFSKDATIVPEPSAALAFGVGSLIVGFYVRRRPH